MRKTYMITEAAIQLALFAVLFLIALYVPLIGVIATLFLALPFIIFTIRHGYAYALLLLAASLIISMLIGSLFSLPVALMFGTAGIAIGGMLAKNKSRHMILLISALIFLINIVVDYAISVKFLQMDIIQETISTFRQSFDTAMKMMKGMGQEPSPQLQEQFKQGLELVKYIVPTLFVLASFLFAYITIIASIPVLKRLKLPVGTWPPFREVTLPKGLLWIYVLVLALSFIPFEKGTFAYIAILNVYYVLQLLLMVQGFSFLYHVANKKNIPKGMVIGGTVFCLFLPFLLYLIAILGIIDLGFDLRKRI
ncbi:YybS family protein [Parageobacillus sp. VR-IP]|uniref:YybS family protein n=1 Tax=Parageobacillus sp. VR-IP TaxID=2742205 RepID=UPI0015820BD1|nr:YybS family protein [Parageobacillus sp. VR-IP]NUK30057.1 YybS family protein [Parageobacillus sp. VR-IP]